MHLLAYLCEGPFTLARLKMTLDGVLSVAFLTSLAGDESVVGVEGLNLIVPRFQSVVTANQDSVQGKKPSTALTRRHREV